jgi:hypothetical protein
VILFPNLNNRPDLQPVDCVVKRTPITHTLYDKDSLANEG